MHTEIMWRPGQQHKRKKFWRESLRNATTISGNSSQAKAASGLPWKPAQNAAKQLAATSEETNGGDGASSIRIVSDKSHCEVRDWLMTRPLIENSGRSGVAANIKVMHGSKYL